MKTVILFGLVLGALSAAGKVFFAEVGQKVNLQCGVNSFKSVVEWIDPDKKTVRINRKGGFPGKGQSQIASRAQIRRDTDLEISNVQESDFGEFTCKVDGTPYKHTLVMVSVSVFPSGVVQSGTDVTLDCKVSSLGDAINVWWSSPNGSPRQTQKVELKPVDPSDGGPWQCRVSHDGEEFSKDVAIVVKSPDPKPTTPAIERNPDFPNSKNGKNSTGGASDWTWGEPLLGLSWWIWVAIGAAGLVVIILMVVVVVVYKRTKRRKKRFMRMKRAQLSQMPKKYCQCARQTAAAKPHQGRRRREKPSALPLQPLLQE
ncbi:T-cell surface glycoprotein CD4 [Fundulus heteroclitus]|uniref:T-cell surface glycoprotein CD4 n=1 Tax=Fundulus heteroclitus TaxID=8078 RepID=UPI00165B8456|nr:T-cell surface glycoprotein CD4 [Fundulus heteroclitus]